MKGALFLCAGILLNTRGSVDEAQLHGRGRDLRITAACFLIGGLALAALPPFGTSRGKALIEDGLSHAGFGWAGVLLAGVSAMTGGAVLRAGIRIFLGAGSPPDTRGDTHGRDEHRETDHDIGRPPVTMLAPIVALLAGGLALGLLPGLATRARVASPAVAGSDRVRCCCPGRHPCHLAAWCSDRELECVRRPARPALSGAGAAGGRRPVRRSPAARAAGNRPHAAHRCGRCAACARAIWATMWSGCCSASRY